MQADNILIFVNVKGDPYDEGSRELFGVLEIPNDLRVNYLKSTVIPYRGKRKHCILAVPKYRAVDLVSMDDICDTLNNVETNVTELGLESFSIAKTDKIDDGLVGYDCGGSSMNTSTLSLLDVGECKIANTPPQSETVNIYLLQPAEIIQVHVMECKILINWNIQHCGMHSHTSLVLYGRREYYMDIDYNKCKRMHETGSVWLFDRVPFYELKMNSTSHRLAILAGSQSMGGDCEKGTFSDEYGTWSGVVVDATFEITLTEYETALNTKTNEVMLRSGTIYNAEKLTCVTSDGMSAFWSEVPKDSCLMKYAQLYHGPATKLVGQNESPDIYSLTTEDITFALAQRGWMDVCGHTDYRQSAPPEEMSYGKLSKQLEDHQQEDPRIKLHECLSGETLVRLRNREVRDNSQIDPPLAKN
ncbi:Protein of unknown function [Cotesia congregata]|uniref:Uncharacterized protein n=1 Tax=Cotesia congregata TaxID=51543 RepID=A0A8J2EM45_COTCN|nr:Protein of unknown function [Cotesia congregata]